MTGGRSGNVEPGWVFWVTGLAGAGKTTVAAFLVDRLRAMSRPAVLLDGDELRAAFEHELDYTLDDRRRAARRYSRLARLIASQGVDVVVATISMFHACRAWNRRHCERYVEIYLRGAAATLASRRRLRRAGRARPDCNVVGLDLPFEEPEAADLVVETDDFTDGTAVARHVWRTVANRIGAPRRVEGVGLH